jgi:hypothetical protein
VGIRESDKGFGGELQRAHERLMGGEVPCGNSLVGEMAAVKAGSYV